GQGWPRALISIGVVAEEVVLIHHQNN
ncbi:hypothetical protein MNL34_12715, partial [Acinetobacter baumannii]|nr:hypothetical protein [Acinetobacter baumannii]